MRLLKDLDTPIVGRHVLVVEDVVDTGLTLQLPRADARRCGSRRASRRSRSSTGPYRRLVDDVPLGYVGFTVPDELFAGYGLGLDERWRALPDLHVVATRSCPHCDVSPATRYRARSDA